MTPPEGQPVLGDGAGPATLGELFQWHRSATMKLLADDDSKEALVSLSQLHVAMTTEFSGMGSAEIAVNLTLQGIRSLIAARRGRACISCRL